MANDERGAKPSRIQASELKAGDELVPDFSVKMGYVAPGNKNTMSYHDGANTDAGTITSVDVAEGTHWSDSVTVGFTDPSGKEHVKMFCRGQNVLVARVD